MNCFLYITFLSAIALANTVQVRAQSNLLVTPTRIEFSGDSRHEVLSVTNTGNEPATYRISFLHYHMDEHGNLTQITVPDSGQYFADSLIRFFPKQVTLLPGLSQTVRMQLVRPLGLLPGEYRSHVVFRKLAAKTRPNESESATNVQITLKAALGVAIPVIVRHKLSEPVLKITEAYMHHKNGHKELTFKLSRSGESSSYGDIVVLFKLPGGGEHEGNLVKGVAVYGPNTCRIIHMDLDRIPEEAVSLAVEYRKHGQKTILAKSEIVLDIAQQ